MDFPLANMQKNAHYRSGHHLSEFKTRIWVFPESLQDDLALSPSCFHPAVSSTLFLLWLFELATPPVGVIPRRPPSRQPGVGLHSADAQARCSLNIPSAILGGSPHGANEEQVKVSSVHVSPLSTTLWSSCPYHQPGLVSWWFLRFTS